MTNREKRALLPALSVAWALSAGQHAAAYEIYKWVDENGVVNYSETRPEEPAEAVATLHIPATNPPGYDPAEDPWSIVNQAGRINAEWTALKEERERAEASERARAAEQRVAELEQRLAAAEAAAYRARSAYAPLPWLAGHRHRFFERGFGHHSPERRPPRRDRGADPAPGPGWTGPREPSGPAVPGFGAPESR